MSKQKSATPDAPVAVAAPSEGAAPPSRVRELIDVPVVALGAPGTIAVRGDDGNWHAMPAGAA
jgi:hypothetical protein